MAALDIPCPECGRLLRIPDRAMLGKKARCGKCHHKFILQEQRKREVVQVAQARLHISSGPGPCPKVPRGEIPWT